MLIFHLGAAVENASPLYPLVEVFRLHLVPYKTIASVKVESSWW